MADSQIRSRDRRAVRERAKGCCEYCRSQDIFSPQPFAVEHIQPRSKGGSGELANLCWACQGCNGHKHTKIEGIDPVSGRPTSLFHPRDQVWTDHFAWDHTFSRIVGLTPTGRSTVVTLHLNREGLVNLRQVLQAVGEHPPDEAAAD